MSTGDDNEQHHDEPDNPQERQGMRTWCRDCEGKGVRIIPRMAVLSGGRSLSAVMRDSQQFVTGFETRPCETCDATGWLPGFVPPV